MDNVNLSKFELIWSSESIPIINIILNNASAVAITVITTPACIKCTTWIKIDSETLYKPIDQKPN